MYGPNYVQFLFFFQNQNLLLDGSNLVTSFNEKVFRKGLNRWITFWINKNTIEPGEGEFIIKYRDLEIPEEWQKDVLINNINIPWSDIGVVTWDNLNEPFKIDFNNFGQEKFKKYVEHQL